MTLSEQLEKCDVRNPLGNPKTAWASWIWLKQQIAQLETELEEKTKRAEEYHTDAVAFSKQLQQAQEEIAAWEAKAQLFVDQGDELERLRAGLGNLHSSYSKLWNEWKALAGE